MPKILIIEDDPVARRVLHAALTAATEQRALAAGARAILPKAVRPENVVANVEEIVGAA